MDDPIEVSAPAKVNLFLRVEKRRADGFHPLRTWMCTAGLHDRLAIIPAPDGQIDLTTDRPDLPTDERNLVCRAARAMSARAGDRGVSIRLTKRIPMGAGLAGGSSDAAATLIALDRLWSLKLGAAKLAAAAAALGSDVPFFLAGGSALCTGRGEVVEPVAAPSAGHCVLILPPAALSTAEVYKRFDEMSLDATAEQPDARRINSWAPLPAAELMMHLFNDLETAAFSIRPELGELRRELESRLDQPVRMSGSGSALFTLADDREGALALVCRAKEAGVDAIAVDCPA